MKSRLCCIPLVVFSLLPGMLAGASSRNMGEALPNMGEALPSNYQFELDAQAGEEVVHVSFVVASERFEVSVGNDLNMTFSGTVSLADDGTLFLAYNLAIRQKVTMSVSEGGEGRPSSQYVNNGLMGSVRMREGKQISLITVGNRSFKLKIAKLAEE